MSSAMSITVFALVDRASLDRASTYFAKTLNSSYGLVSGLVPQGQPVVEKDVDAWSALQAAPHAVGPPVVAKRPQCWFVPGPVGNFGQ